MIPDKLLVNLKILSKIQKNGRICRSYDGIIALENESLYQPLKRFLTNDSRKQAVFEINSIITECIDTLHYFMNSKYMTKENSYTDEYLKTCENMHLILSEMELARTGIINLKFTYQSDPNIASQLDIIILKVNTTIRDFGHKLNYFQSFLKNIHGDNFTPQNQYHNEVYNVIENVSNELNDIAIHKMEEQSQYSQDTQHTQDTENPIQMDSII